MEEGISVLVFPEGTRHSDSKPKKYARGGAGLATAANVPMIMLAHNAAQCWPTNSFIKHPGTIQLKISEPVDTQGKTSRELTELAQAWIEEKVADIA